MLLCPGWDSNPHALRHSILSAARIPFRHPGILRPRWESNPRIVVLQTTAFAVSPLGQNLQLITYNYFLSFSSEIFSMRAACSAPLSSANSILGRILTRTSSPNSYCRRPLALVKISNALSPASPGMTLTQIVAFLKFSDTSTSLMVVKDPGENSMCLMINSPNFF